MCTRWWLSAISRVNRRRETVQALIPQMGACTCIVGLYTKLKFRNIDEKLPGTSCHVMSIMSCFVMPCHVVSCYHVMSCKSCHVMSCYVTTCDVMSCHVIASHLIPVSLIICYRTDAIVLHISWRRCAQTSMKGTLYCDPEIFMNTSLSPLMRC